MLLSVLYGIDYLGVMVLVTAIENK